VYRIWLRISKYHPILIDVEAENRSIYTAPKGVWQKNIKTIIVRSINSSLRLESKTYYEIIYLIWSDKPSHDRFSYIIMIYHWIQIVHIHCSDPPTRHPFPVQHSGIHFRTVFFKYQINKNYIFFKVFSLLFYYLFKTISFVFLVFISLQNPSHIN